MNDLNNEDSQTPDSLEINIPLYKFFIRKVQPLCSSSSPRTNDDNSFNRHYENITKPKYC